MVVIVEPEATGEHLRDLALDLAPSPELPGCGHDAHDRHRALQQRVGPPDVAHHRGEHLEGPADVHRRERAAHPHVVAGHGGQHVHVGGAADVAEERGVEHPLPLRIRQAQLLCHPGREEADGQPVLHRLAHGDVGGKGHRGHQLGQAELLPRLDVGLWPRARPRVHGVHTLCLPSPPRE
jgi:hypothetical protein